MHSFVQLQISWMRFDFGLARQSNTKTMYLSGLAWKLHSHIPCIARPGLPGLKTKLNWYALTLNLALTRIPRVGPPQNWKVEIYTEGGRIKIDITPQTGSPKSITSDSRKPHMRVDLRAAVKSRWSRSVQRKLLVSKENIKSEAKWQENGEKAMD